MHIQSLSSNKRELFGIILTCFLAPAIYFIFSNYTFLALDRLVIGFTESKPSSWGILGCPPQKWMYPVRSSIFKILITTFMLLGYLTSKKARFQNSFPQLLLGALLFMPVVHFTGVWLINFLHSPFGFLKNKEQLLSAPLPILGNFYYYRWVEFGVSSLLICLYTYIGLQIILQYWTPFQRISLLFFGSIACLLGYLCWFFLVGPWVFPFSFHH